MKKTLTEREKHFCFHYINTGNLREAATLAGYGKEPEKKAIELLGRKNVKEEIERLYTEKKKTMAYKAYIGYERLAFGNVADAIKLLCTEKPDKLNLEKMDLFNICEIKRPKDGAMEIKFFDRLRALEKLEQANDEEKQEINPIYYAMEQGIKALEESSKKMQGN